MTEQKREDNPSSFSYNFITPTVLTKIKAIYVLLLVIKHRHTPQLDKDEHCWTAETVENYRWFLQKCHKIHEVTFLVTEIFLYNCSSRIKTNMVQEGIK